MNATTIDVTVTPVFFVPARRRIDWSRLKGLASLVSPLLLLAAWTCVTRAHWFSEQILVPPQAVLDAFHEVWDSGELPGDLKISLYRLLLGFSLGGVAGVLLGTLLATSLGSVCRLIVLGTTAPTFASNPAGADSFVLTLLMSW